MLSSVRLQNFRSYDDASFEFDDGVNIIVGPNASGKTNILEALLIGLRGSSYRAGDVDIVKHGSAWARLDIESPQEKRVIKITQGDTRFHKEFEINAKIIKRLRFEDKHPVVMFEPNNLQMLSGSPERRRDYLDDMLEQIQNDFGPLRRAYKRTLAQRNALLKQYGSDAKDLFAWNVRLSDLAGQIVARRLTIVAEVNNLAAGHYHKFSQDRTELSVSYKSAINGNNYSSALLSQLEASIELDRLRGFTTHGPHRDDMDIKLNGKLLGQTASRGESRTTMLVLKQIESSLLEQALGKKPTLLLDDVFSELDGARRKALTDNLSGYQCFITTTDADVVLHNFVDHHRLIALVK